MRIKFLFVFLLLGAFLCFTQPASAAPLVLELNAEFSGAYEPEGPAPWLRATFDDGGGTGSVTLTLDANLGAGAGLIEQEYVKEWLFNFDGGVGGPTLSDLNFSPTAGTILSLDAINVGPDNNYRADGNGFFDIQFDFAEGNRRFGSPDGSAGGNDYISQLVFTITADGLEQEMFGVKDSSDKFRSAAHVGGIDIPGGEEDGGSGWIATPIPGSALLLAPGLILLGALRRKFKS